MARLVYRQRLSRVLAGGVGVCAGIAMFIASWIDPISGSITLGLGWAAMLLMYLLGEALGHINPERLGKSRAELEEKLEFWSFSLPMAALSLLMPLSLHALISLVQGFDPKEFGEWIAMSGIVVGFAHMSLVAMCGVLVQKICASPMTFNKHLGWLAWGVSIGASCIPGILLMAIPPVVTAITGLLFVPWMFYLARIGVLHERAKLQEEALRHPKLVMRSDGIEHISATGKSRRVEWMRPFRVIVHRDHTDEEELHVRLIQRKGEEQRSVALTLALPFELDHINLYVFTCFA